MSWSPTPNWQPISFLPKLAPMIDGMLDSAEDVCRSLQHAKQRGPHMLDDDTINRVRDVHGTQFDDLWLYKEQLARWGKKKLNAVQCQEIQRLRQQLERLRPALTSTLERADALIEGTREKMMAKSDIELAIEALTRKRKLEAAPGFPSSIGGKLIHKGAFRFSTPPSEENWGPSRYGCHPKLGMTALAPGPPCW